MTRVAQEARKDTVLFRVEFSEPLDPAASDWDATAWGEVRRKLDLSNDDAEALWDDYQEALIKHTERLAERIPYEVEYAAAIWPGAKAESLRDLALKAETVARQAEADFDPEIGAFSAGQSEYGCDWKWKDGEDVPTIRVFDCDGNPIEELTCD